MTSLPASQFALAQRGILTPGAFADVLLIDPLKLRDHASFADPHRLSEGVTDILVNGVPVLSNGKLTGHRPGRWL
jgi:N-acyl-D-amino-acid deacylase